MNLTTIFWFKLCDTLILAEELPLQDADRETAIKATAEFVEGQIACLPVVLRTLTGLALLCFKTIVFLKHGRRFENLPSSTARREVENWENFDVLPFGKLLVSIRSLCSLHFFEQPCVQAALDELHRHNGTIYDRFHFAAHAQNHQH